MAVLVEAFSVVTRRTAIDTKFRGAWAAFVAEVPNATLCYDSDLARVGFMTSQDVSAYVQHLQNDGLIFLADDKAHDIAVVDQHRGPTTACDWLEFARLPFGDGGGKVSACWLFEEPRIAAGIHFPGKSIKLHTPPGWDYEDSLSHESVFVPNPESQLLFLRHEDGLDVFMDRETGEECFMARKS